MIWNSISVLQMNVKVKLMLMKLNNLKVFRTPSPRTNISEHFFCRLTNNLNLISKD